MYLTGARLTRDPQPHFQAARPVRPQVHRAIGQGSALGASWNFSMVPIRGADRGFDGSPDDQREMQEDQDALAPSVFERGRTGRGAHIRVTGGSPNGTRDYPDGLRWVQTIDTNAPLFGQSSPYVDFIPPKDDKPFYFPDARENATFSDNPSRKANSVRWDATLSLVGVRGRAITRLDSVNYGFDIDGRGILSLHGPSTDRRGRCRDPRRHATL